MQDESQGSRVEVYSVTKMQRSRAISQFLMIRSWLSKFSEYHIRIALQ